MKAFTIKNAMQKAFQDAKANNSKNKKIILLSPACASFDQFKNFEERGEAFKREITKLIK